MPSADRGESRVGDYRAECFTGQSRRSEIGLRDASKQSLQDAVAHSIDEKRSIVAGPQGGRGFGHGGSVRVWAIDIAPRERRGVLASPRLA